jgi:hypothetical protein
MGNYMNQFETISTKQIKDFILSYQSFIPTIHLHKHQSHEKVGF